MAELRRRRLERSLGEFVRAAWPVLEPGRNFVDGWHIDLIAEHLEAVSAGQIRRLIINVPPRHMKSLLTSVLWPAWTWAKRPESRWLFASYSASLATKHSVDRRTLIASDWYQGLWGGRWRLADDQNQKAEFQNSARGVMVATSVGGTATGKGGDVVVVDDPHNPLQAASDAERDAALAFFDQTLTTRLDDPARGAMVVIMQRLHERDLSGHLLAKGGWTHLRLPAEAEKAERHVFPVSGRVVEREAGQPLWAERYPADVLTTKKVDMGSAGYAGQMQQRPSPAGGGIVQRDWWRFYGALPDRFDEILQSWDCAFKGESDSDYVVGQVWGRIGAQRFLLDQVRARMSFPATLDAIKALSAKWPAATLKLVEDKANGPAVIATLKLKVTGLVAVEPEGGKVARLQAVSPLIEAGNVLLPEGAPWVSDLLQEFTAFPRGANDDQVDAASQALLRMQQSGGGLMDFYKQEAERPKAAKEKAEKNAA